MDNDHNFVAGDLHTWRQHRRGGGTKCHLFADKQHIHCASSAQSSCFVLSLMVSSCYQWACTVAAGSAHRTAEHCIKKYHDWVDDSQGEFSEQKGWRGQQMLWKSYVEDPRWLRDKVWKSYYYYFRGKDVIWIPRLFFLASSFLLFPLLRSFLATELSRVS